MFQCGVLILKDISESPGSTVHGHVYTVRMITVLQHLGNLPPPEGDFQEMICDDCMTKCSFLQAYLSLSGKQNYVRKILKKGINVLTDHSRKGLSEPWKQAVKQVTLNNGNNIVQNSNWQEEDHLTLTLCREFRCASLIEV